MENEHTNINPKEFIWTTLNSLQDMFFVLDWKGKFLVYNNVGLKVTGYTEEELKTMNPLNFFSGKDALAVAAAISKAWKEGYGTVEANVRTKDGRTIPYEFVASVVKDESGNIIGLSGTGRDISARKKMEEKLKEREELYRALFESSKDAIMTLSPPGWRFFSGNKATFELFNVKDEAEFESLGPWDLSPEFQPDGTRSDEKAKTMINKAMEEGSNFFEWTHKRYRGDNFSATVLLTKIVLNDKQFLQAIVRDVSLQKEAEKKILERTKELEALNEIMVGRELKMIELKNEIELLKKELQEKQQ